VIVTLSNSGPVLARTVRTITVQALDLSIGTGNLSVSDPSPIAGDQVVINFTVFCLGPVSSLTSGNFLSQLYIDGTPYGASIEHDSLQVSHFSTISDIPWTPLETGAHTIEVRTDTGNALEEYDETNNIASVMVDISENQPPLLSPTPPSPQEMNEGDTLHLRCNATDPETDQLTFKWYINGTPLAVIGPSFDFTSEYTGENSSTFSPYQVIVVVADDRDIQVQQENQTSWTITVSNINRPPIITAHQPLDLSQTLSENESIGFNLSATDPDGSQVHYSWSQDGQPVGNDVSNYTFFAPYIGFGSKGIHIINCTISDPDQGYVSLEWEVDVLDVNRPPQVKIVTPQNNANFTPDENITFLANASDPDGDNLTYQWRHDGLPLTTLGSFTRSFEEGVHTIELEVGDTIGGIATDSVTIIVAQEVSNGTEDPGTQPSDNDTGDGGGMDDNGTGLGPDGDTQDGEGDEKEGSTRGIMIAIFVVIVIVIIVVILVLILYRKRRVPPQFGHHPKKPIEVVDWQDEHRSYPKHDGFDTGKDDDKGFRPTPPPPESEPHDDDLEQF